MLVLLLKTDTWILVEYINTWSHELSTGILHYLNTRILEYSITWILKYVNTLIVLSTWINNNSNELFALCLKMTSVISIQWWWLTQIDSSPSTSCDWFYLLPALESWSWQLVGKAWPIMNVLLSCRVCGAQICYILLVWPCRSALKRAS